MGNGAFTIQINPNARHCFARGLRRGIYSAKPTVANYLHPEEETPDAARYPARV
jgi:hypothetical protein